MVSKRQARILAAALAAFLVAALGASAALAASTWTIKPGGPMTANPVDNG